MILTREHKPWSPCGRREVHQDYYVPRPCQEQDADYWAPKADPDGIVRDRTSNVEREQYLADVCDEIRFVNGLKPRCVVDVGAGLGWMLSAVDAERRYAIEPSPVARQSLEQHCDRVFDSLATVPSFYADVVLAHHVFEHMSDPVSEINHVRRVLTPGGHLVLGTPDFASPCAKWFGSNYRMLHDPTHCSLFSLEGMTRMLRDHAFQILDVKFPFPDRYATAETFARWNDTSKISPPWPGNWMTFYCRR